MQRREVVKLLAGASLPFFSPDVFYVFHAAYAKLPTTYELRTLNVHQNATVTMLSELIIPQTDTPGAKSVRVNEFIDLILTEWYNDRQRAGFLRGLADVDVRGHDLFGKDFVDCSQVQQLQLVARLDEEVYGRRAASPESPTSSSSALADSGAGTPMEEQFFYMLKRLTLIGYYTSRELSRPFHWGDYAGCVLERKE